MRFLPVQMLSAPDTGNAVGAAIDSNQAVSGSFCPIFGDTAATGTVKIQCSNDSAGPSGYRNTFVPTNWSDIPNATSTIAAGVGPAIVIPNMAFGYIRAVFTGSGGSTTIIVNATLLSI